MECIGLLTARGVVLGGSVVLSVTSSDDGGVEGVPVSVAGGSFFATHETAMKRNGRVRIKKNSFFIKHLDITYFDGKIGTEKNGLGIGGIVTPSKSNLGHVNAFACIHETGRIGKSCYPVQKRIVHLIDL